MKMPILARVPVKIIGSQVECGSSGDCGTPDGCAQFRSREDLICGHRARHYLRCAARDTVSGGAS